MIGFPLVMPTGRAYRNRKELLPPVEEAGAKILEAMQLAQHLELKVEVPENCFVPLCVIPEAKPFFWHLTEGRQAPLAPDRTRFPGCSECSWGANCPGFHQEYVRMYPDFFTDFPRNPL